MPENNTENNSKPNKNYAFESAKVLGVAFELGFEIALPILGFGYLGKWLDQKHGSGYFVYIGIIFAIIFTTIVIYRRFATLIEKLKEAARIDRPGDKIDKK